MKKSSYFVKGLLVLSLVGTMAMANGDKETNDNSGKEMQIKSSIQIKDSVNEINEKSAAKIDAKDVLKIVTSKFKGKVMDVQLENINGNLVYQADVLKNNQITNLFIDAGNGKILASSVENSNNENNKEDGESEGGEENESDGA